MKQLVGFTVTYKSRRADTFTSTYHFMADYGRTIDKASTDAWNFMRAIDNDGGQAGYPHPVWNEGK
jgi:hypothetical protein